MLTTNLLVFSLDSRLGVSLEPGQNNWGLVIQSAQERDSASYLCQVSALSGTLQVRGVADSSSLMP